MSDENIKNISDEFESMTSLIQALKRASSNEHGNKPIQVTADVIVKSDTHEFIALAGDHIIGIDTDFTESDGNRIRFTIYNYLHGLEFIEKNDEEYEHFFIV